MYTHPKFSASLALISLVNSLVFPQYSWTNYSWSNWDSILEQEIKLFPLEGLVTLYGQALIQPANPDTPVVVAQYWVIITAYSSTFDQTDSTPFITASGTYVRDGVVACNFLKFGTRVRFPQLYGEKIFVVEDRMAPRNSHKMDVWFVTRWQAKQFGVKKAKVEVLEA